jgi:hypothetical protein
MPWADAAGAWEPVETMQVSAEATLWLVEFALAGHEGVYYLRLRTYQAGAPAARVRVVGPYPDVMHALAAVQDLIRGATRDLAGVVWPPPAQETRSAGPASPGTTPGRPAP